MRISDLNHSVVDGRARASARVSWEDCDRPERDIRYETDLAFSDDLTCNPDAFLAAVFLPAMHHGERRVQVEGSVCPQLRDGLLTAVDTLGSWYGAPGHQPVAIEPTEGFIAPRPRSPRRVGALMSGGVDAQATLHWNRQSLPLDHPRSIRDGLLIHGVDVGGYELEDKNIEHFDLALSAMSQLAEEMDFTLIPIYTNIRYLEESDDLFANEMCGAALASVFHAFSTRLTAGLIPSGWPARDLAPCGSHPLLDPHYSSAGLTIVHDGVLRSRLEKVRLISESGAALRFLRPCFNPFRPGDRLNCGRCEKCLRTMMELLVVGKLGQCQSFPENDVTAEMLQGLIGDLRQLRSFRDGCYALGHGAVWCWGELIEPLRQQGREDLAQAIEEKLREVERYAAWAEERDWKGRARRLDRRFLGGSLLRLRRLLQGRSSLD